MRNRHDLTCGWCRPICAAMLFWTAATSATLAAGSEADVTALLDAGKYKEAVAALKTIVADQPANDSARSLLAETYEKAGQPDEAIQTWQELLRLSQNPEKLHEARKAISRLRRQSLDAVNPETLTARVPQDDPFYIPMPEVDWTGLEKIEDSRYIPSPIPSAHPYDVPPFVYETEHFTVYAANERYAKLVGDRAEIYLRFMIDKLFAGRAWAVRFPIFVYRDANDYFAHGAPQGSAGVTFGHETGKTQKILIYQLAPKEGRRGKGGGGGGGGDTVWKYALESVLPHELTHAVLNEFFGGQEIPRWLHEAVAGRFEQTRKHYFEAARFARFVLGGEYFRMRDLFEHKGGYPERISLFYEQAAIVVLYLFETGPEAMNAFLTELAAGNDHDAACAAALGIPQEGAVEEFEKRWVDWMKIRYLKDHDRKRDFTVMADAAVSTHKVFLPWVNELETVAAITDWRTVDLASMDAFSGVGQSKSEWSTGGGVLRCEPKERGGSSILGLRMNEIAPVALTFEVRFLGSPGGSNSFGLTQLDANGQDTRIEVSARLSDSATHSVVALWSDDLALYVDGVCTGRYPAYQVKGNEQEVNYPLAFVAYGPVEIQNIKIAAIKKFSDKPVLAAGEEQKPEETSGRRRGSSRRERGQPSGPSG